MVEYDPMLRPRHGLTAILVAFGLITAACSARAPVSARQAQPVFTAVAPVSAAVPAAVPAQQAQPQRDPVVDLIALSTRYFENGQRELQAGHLDSAKSEFNRSLELLLESPYGARTEPRIREHFDRLVERISAYEVTALAQGDGFTEKKYEPATIDDLLAISTFEQPPATPETKQVVSDDLLETAHDIDIPLNARVLQYVQLFTGRLKGYLEDGLSRGARYLPMIQDVFRAEGLPLDQAERRFDGESKGHVAVHERHRPRERPEARLVYRRTRRSGESDSRRRQVPENAQLDVPRLASRARFVQRWTGPGAARGQAIGPGRFLAVDGHHPLPAA
jgi:hypothetical protein